MIICKYAPLCLILSNYNVYIEKETRYRKRHEAFLCILMSTKMRGIYSYLMIKTCLALYSVCISNKTDIGKWDAGILLEEKDLYALSDKGA